MYKATNLYSIVSDTKTIIYNTISTLSPKKDCKPYSGIRPSGNTDKIKAKLP